VAGKDPWEEREPSSRLLLQEIDVINLGVITCNVTPNWKDIQILLSSAHKKELIKGLRSMTAETGSGRVSEGCEGSVF
jgi:hypothetical protein